MKGQSCDIAIQSAIHTCRRPRPPPEQTDTWVEHARKIFPQLGAVGMFGAALALSAFYTANPQESHATSSMLAWSYATFILSTSVSLVSQLALNNEFIPNPHRRWRSEGGMAITAAISLLGIAAGTLLLGVSFLTGRSKQSSVRAAGAVATAGLLVLIVFSAVSLYRTFQRRRSVWQAQLDPPISVIRALTPREPSFEHMAPDTEVRVFLRLRSAYGRHLDQLLRIPGFRNLPSFEQAVRVYALSMVRSALGHPYALDTIPQVDCRPISLRPIAETRMGASEDQEHPTTPASQAEVAANTRPAPRCGFRIFNELFNKRSDLAAAPHAGCTSVFVLQICTGSDSPIDPNI